jgi:hypothetical protein
MTIMQKHWNNRTVLALGISVVLSGLSMQAAQAADGDIPATPTADIGTNGTSANSPTAFAASNDPTAATTNATQSEAQIPETTTSPDPTGTGVESVTTTSAAMPAATATPAPATPSMAVPDAKTSASSALGQKEGDASAEKNLDQVFKATEKSYSLLKSGTFSSSYDFDYTYYRDSRLDLALSDDSSTINRLRIEDDAQHTVTNSFDVQYGLRDNLTLNASLPLVAKADVANDRSTAGLGDVSFGARWEPFPLERGKMPLILFGTLSTKTGDSPYEINPLYDLATGKGYYSIGGGASTRKFIDPIVLFGSFSMSYGFKESGINQKRSGRTITDFDPGVTGGIALGFAYSLNYDVSLTMSYQQSFSSRSEFTFAPQGEDGATYSRSADQTSASMNMSLGVRVSPKTIVNGSVGFGLTEDAPDVSLGLSFPLDLLGFAPNTDN